ncbi:hypothetical protein XELAEV_18013965mg [Xenopus laevis]|uniref:Uncharacterized protein n=1 Tax=Xenopus laevis TaxID=8355 RepID=A0A974HZN9_XENLA|nr:hypothetical protein XELAEV_18013965mg [Xenopus laevis]
MRAELIPHWLVCNPCDKEAEAILYTGERESRRSQLPYTNTTKHRPLYSVFGFYYPVLIRGFLVIFLPKNDCTDIFYL